MTRIAVLGATGGTGRAVLDRALREGHYVTALVRQPSSLGVEHASLEIRQGDAHRFSDVDAVVAGNDAVFVSLGLAETGSNSEVVTVCTVGIRNVLESMRDSGVQRLVAMSTHGANESNDGSEYARFLWDLVGERVRDKESMEVLIRASPVQWTIIRAPLITSDPSRGDYEVGETLKIDRSSSISHENLASFVLAELVAPSHVGRALSITE